MILHTYTAAKVIIVCQSRPREILLIKRRGSYEPAGGTIKPGEILEDCAKREVKEELGIDIRIDRYAGNYNFFWERNEFDNAPIKHSTCIVFIGTILNETGSGSYKVENADRDEIEFEPIWVSIKSVLNNEIHIDPKFIGLSQILLNYCNSL